jgi:hypothetical protein
MNDIEFVPGLIVKQRAPNAPDYVICKLSIKPKELASWLEGKTDEWVNVEVKIGKSGKPYAAVDSWKPSGVQARQPVAQPQRAPASGFDDMDDGDAPF